MAVSRTTPSWATKASAGLALGAGAAPFFMKQPDYINPANAAMPTLQQVPDAVSPYFKPYIDTGNTAMGDVNKEYNQQINDPGAVNAKLGAGYQQSPGYQFKLHQALMAGDNAAAAGGMAGSNQHQQNNIQLANDISSQDFNDYMNRVLGIYNTGVSGKQGLSNQGFNASTDLGTSIGNNLQSQALLKYQGANQENEANQAQTKSDSGLWGNLAGLAGNALKAFAL